MYGVETFRSFVDGWYDGDLQDVIFFGHKDPVIRRMICSGARGLCLGCEESVHRVRNPRAWLARAGEHGEGGRVMKLAGSLFVRLSGCVGCRRSGACAGSPPQSLRPHFGRSCRPRRSAANGVVNQVVRGAFGCAQNSRSTAW